MEAVKLLDRHDTKFTLRAEQLPAILRAMRPNYRLLEMEGIRASRYETLYFDTPRLELYARHHSGKFVRHKVRCRKYVDSDRCFFEIKAKTNKGRTVKTRIPRPELSVGIDSESAQLLRSETPFQPGDLKPVLWVRFTRMTFVGRASAERLTIDQGLAFQHETSAIAFPRLVVAEVKRGRSCAASAFIQLMREKKIWEGSMSKYCFGIVHLCPGVKTNLFKERVRQLNRLAA